MKNGSNIRTFALVAHTGAGKTSLAEALLYTAGVTTRLNKVDQGNSLLDYEPEEIKRKITISTSFCTFEWNKHIFNLIDTPGDFNFIGDMQMALHGADGVIVVVDAVDGIKVQTEKAWELADALEHPRFIFISKIDRERADFQKTVDEIVANFGDVCVPLIVPVGAGEDFKGVVNVLEQKAYMYGDDESGKFEVTEPPADLADLVEQYREQIMERVAESDDELLEKYLEGEALTPEEIEGGIKKAIISQKLIPIACGSGVANKGIAQLLNLIEKYFPSPVERGPRKATDPAGNEVERAPSEEEPFSALVIKTLSDPYAGRLTIMRVFSGKLVPDSTVYNSSKQTRERFGNILTLQGKTQKPVQEALPGSIVAVAKLKDTATGDTLCDEKNPVIFKTLPLPPVVYSLAIEPKTRGDEEKIFSSLARLMEEDVALKLERNDETKEMVISGMGEIHIEATVEKLQRKYGVEVNLRLPKVPYKETIKGKARVQGKYKKQTGGRGQYGDCWIEMEPLPRGEGFQFVDKIVGGVIPKQFIPAVEKGIVEAAQEGVLAGYPMIDFKVDLVDGSYHSVDSSELAFKIAGSMAFKKAAMEAKPTLLEPIMYMEIVVPDDCMGDVIGDLNGRRGKVLGMESKGKKQIIKAHVPLAEVQRYAADLRSMTAGRGMFTMRFDHYEEVPAHLQEKIIEQAKAEAEKEGR
ncbi:elongation factor G [Thermodesulforhabdus norvegica]|uniref:Elongation factor G n=1 Tax=Thermodesulforhabdus norvegica TaxID=39841 RepID=A0A1I4QP17_9BACT|nr:elongation factor G [Thermodesulforhabdus norvegica]SFM41784.1 translation elongation factor 2 (EF-2/EF-G) [Thermodesulforhabdus norvegica]